ncbi:MAG: hypothetical protein ACRC8S_06635 [Fimbriiglobus sp.]
MRELLLLLTLISLPLSVSASPITALAYHPSGQQLAIGSRGQVEIQDSAGKSLAKLPGQQSRVTGLAYSKDGVLAVTSGEAGKSGLLRVYDSASWGEPKTSFAAHKDIIYGLAFSPDGKLLATAGYDRVIKLWAVPLGPKPEPVAVLTDHSDTIYALAFSPDGKWLASGAADRAVKLWDVQKKTRITTLPDCTDWVYTIAWHPNGETLFAAGVDRSLRAWQFNGTSGKLVGSSFAHGAAVTKILISPSGDRLFTASEDLSVKGWNPKTLVETRHYPKQADTITAIALHPSGKLLGLGLFDGMVHTLDPNAISMDPPANLVEKKEAPKPPTLAITKLSPDAAPRSSSATITITGTAFNNATSFSTTAPGVKIEVTKQPTDSATTRTVKLTTDATTPIGSITIVAQTGPSTSAGLRFWVDRFAMREESGNTDSAKTGMTITLPTTLTGQLDRNGDVDFYRFMAKAGQEIGAQIVTSTEGAKFLPVLTLTDENGAVLVERNTGSLGYIAPKDSIYAIGVRDQDYRGSAEVHYRLHVGPVPVITSVYPLGTTAGQETKMTIRGVNLGALGEKPLVFLAPSKLGVQPLPVPRVGGDPIGAAEVEVSEFPSTRLEGTTTKVSALPHTIEGTLTTTREPHRISFPAKKGERVILEVAASRLGSPVDSLIEIVDATGKPVERAVLRCTAKSYTTFRDNDSVTSGIRLETWNEFGVDDFLYINGDLMRIDQLPKGPDDDCRFVSVEGKRRSYLGTTPKQNANGTMVYKVEMHPPGSTFPPNGMPLFPIVYRNDDGGPLTGKDSRLAFDPPADGTYTVLIRDANQAGGPTHAYRLHLRSPRPDFSLHIDSSAMKIWKNGGIAVPLRVIRQDDFLGAVKIVAKDLPPSLRMPDTEIEADQTTTIVTLSAGSEPLPKTPVKLTVVGSATIGGKAIQHTAVGPAISIVEQPDLAVESSAKDVSIQPGQETRLTVKIDRLKVKDLRVPIDVQGLPHGVRVMNIGLNGILITPDRTEREVVLYSEPWVKPQRRPITITARNERNGTVYAASPVILQVK